jgi:hypothetical protein
MIMTVSLSSFKGTTRLVSILAVASLTLSSCGSLPNFLSGSREPVLTTEEKAERARGSVFGEHGLIFGSAHDHNPDAVTNSIGVNSFLWRASIDTVAFMPITLVDPFSGVILTDWYSPPSSQSERFRVNIYILDRQLRADAVRAAVFRQQRGQRGIWTDTPIAQEVAPHLEETILSKAREMRLAALAH